jgi:hypothetical protein
MRKKSQYNLEAMDELLVKFGGNGLHAPCTPWHECDVSQHLYDWVKLWFGLSKIIFPNPSRIEVEHLNVYFTSL